MSPIADNSQLNAMSGGDVYASKDVAGVKHSRSLTEVLNAAGTPVDVSPTAPLPATVDTGLLVQRMEELVLAIHQLTGGAAGQLHDGYGRTRVAIETTPAAGLTISPAAAALFNVGTVGGANIGVPMSNRSAQELRNKIVVS